MTKLSKSIYVLSVTDTLIFIFSTFLAGNYFDMPKYTIILTGILIYLFGIYTLYLKGYYTTRNYNFWLKDAYYLLEGLCSATIIPAGIVLFLEFNRTVFYFILSNLGILYILLLIWRICFYEHRKNFKKAKNIIIIGSGSSGNDISAEILKRPEFKLNIVGFVDNDENKLNTEVNGIKIIGKTSELKEIIDKNDIKLVIIAITVKIESQALSDIAECISQNIEIYKMPDIYEKITQKIPVGQITEDWFICNFTRLENAVYEFMKRLFDIGAALVILLVTFPVLIIISIGIKFYDGGSVLYFQDRVGKNGKLFKLYKLRTMIECAEQNGAVWACNNNKDPRVTAIGKFARKLRFDEIPQMINILKGEMSIVGPRPERPEFVKILNKEIPFYNRRHWILPGWTGWAQIMYRYGASVEDATEKLRYDFFYIKHRNIFWDLSILLTAVGKALSGRHG